jgi:hypothetical protein
MDFTCSTITTPVTSEPSGIDTWRSRAACSPRGLVEQVVADDQGGSPASLLVPGLRVEGHRDEVSLARGVRSHLPRAL